MKYKLISFLFLIPLCFAAIESFSSNGFAKHFSFEDLDPAYTSLLKKPKTERLEKTFSNNVLNKLKAKSDHKLKKKLKREEKKALKKQKKAFAKEMKACKKEEKRRKKLEKKSQIKRKPVPETQPVAEEQASVGSSAPELDSTATITYTQGNYNRSVAFFLNNGNFKPLRKNFINVSDLTDTQINRLFLLTKIKIISPIQTLVYAFTGLAEFNFDLFLARLKTRKKNNAFYLGYNRLKNT